MTQTIETQTVDDDAADFPAVWNALIEAILTGFSGSSRPDKARAGTRWLDEADNIYYFYDGAIDIPLFKIDAVNHLLIAPIGGGVASLASASTVNIGSILHNVITITGTTTINSFGDGMKAGQSKKLIFTSALSISNGTSLTLPGGADIQTTSGDMLEVVCTGTGAYKCALFSASGVASSNELASEVTARASADTVLTQSIADEVSARAAADAALQSTINNLGSGKQVFTSSGTITVPVTTIYASACGGGGGGGGGLAVSSDSVLSPGGGGGGYGQTVIRQQISGLTIGDSITVTVGAGGVAGGRGSNGGSGGSSSFGAYITCVGGEFGQKPELSYLGGAGGGFGGQRGSSPISESGANGYGGVGGSGAFGSGGTNGWYGTGYGAGGSGGNHNHAGEVGLPGIIIVEW